MKYAKLLLFVFIFNCLFKTTLKLDENPERARAILYTHVPKGSSQSFARKIMEDNQFTCSLVVQGEFLERKHIDYLYCDRYDLVNIMIARRWQIAFILKNNQIDDIITSTGLLGP